MKTVLWGDGLHDDTAAIQERIDEARHELRLPDPEAFYLISRPLELPSDFKLVLPRFAEVRLAPGSNCLMLKNRTVPDRKERVTDPLWEKMEGTVIKVDRGRKRCCVEFQFANIQRSVWVGYDLVKRSEEDNQ